MQNRLGCTDDEFERVQEDWRVVEQLLPVGWQDKARELGALKRTRVVTDAGMLLRLMLIHLADGCSLRETAVRARQGGIARLSDVALLKRLKGCSPWFQWMGTELMRQWVDAPPVTAFAGRRVRVIDGTIVNEPGVTGSSWRIHYAIGLPGLACEEVWVTTRQDGETLRRFQIRPGEVLIADRGYANAAGIYHVWRHQADLIVRTNLVTLPLQDRKGVKLDILSRLRPLKVGQLGDWPVMVSYRGVPVPGRLVALAKSATAAAIGRRKVARESQRGQHKLRPETLEAAGYIFVFTTLGPAVAAATVLEMYRGRWQIEIAFKRLKSLLQLGHLKKTDGEAAKAWLQGKLLVSLLIAALIKRAESISPWGYPIDGSA